MKSPPAESAAAPSSPLSPLSDQVTVEEGQSCLARWREDGVWYRARVIALGPLKTVSVLFTDYGNEAEVMLEDIVMSASEIPADEEVDEFVEAEPVAETGEKAEVWEEGEECVACWEEDGVWYRAVVGQKLGPGACRVLFTDYGNEAVVTVTGMARTAAGIPEGEVRDENVVSAASALPDSSTVAPQDQATLPQDLTTSTTASKPCTSSPPPELACSLCSGVRNHMSRLVCDRSPVCWNCAVTRINSSHKCWQCEQAPVYTVSHLLKDPVLDMYVREFLDTGRLDPAHTSALRNSRAEDGTIEVKQEEVEGPKIEVGEEVADRMVEEKVASRIVDEKVATGMAVEEVAPRVVMKEVAPRLAVGEECVARWTEDGLWYNGRVEEAEETRALVLFTDYGNKEFAEWDQVRRPA